MPTLSFPHSFTRGALAGQTFATKGDYNESLARSHGFAGETEARRAAVSKPFADLSREERSLFNKATAVAGRVSRGESLSRASKAEGIRSETVLKYRPDVFTRFKSGYVPEGRGWMGKGTSWINVLTPGGFEVMPIRSRSDRELNSAYLNAVERVLSGDADVRARGHRELAGFQGRSIKDANGVRHPFITDEGMLRMLAEAGELSLESMYGEQEAA